jgi:ankyrin repeat protein
MPDALGEALKSGHPEALRQALATGPKPASLARAVVSAGGRALQEALEILQHNGANLNAVWRGYRPLHALLQEAPHAHSGKPSPQRLACLDWLLAHGADPELTGAWPPARAIIIAAFMGQPEYVRRLRKGGAKMDGFAAAALGKRELVEKTLRQHPDFARERDQGGLTALQCAAGSELAPDAALEIARLLIDAGADVAAQTKSWNNLVDAVYFAVGSRNRGIFELLLDHGADPHRALSSALWPKRCEFAEIALAHGAKPDLALAGRQPLLNNLVRWGQLQPVFWLLAHGASPNIPDSKGWTAVHQAASRGNVRMLRALLDAGGDLTHRDKQDCAPKDVAVQMRREKLIPLLQLTACRLTG